MKTSLRSCVAAMLGGITLLTAPVHAQVPNLLNYQGRVAVGTVNFDGSGQFKFALVNAAGTTTYWSNDGTSTAGSQPAAAVSLTVTKGLYSVLLGDTSLANMTAVPASVFANADVRLRVWFNDGTNGSQLLTPDQRLAAVGYAMVAGSATTVPDGAITSAKLAIGAVTNTQLGTGAVQLANFAAGIMSSGNAGGALVLRDAGGSFSARDVHAFGVFNLLSTVNASTGVLTQNGTRLLHTYGSQNFFAGPGAGNFTMTGADNTGTGFQTLFSNTTGGGNTASGINALYSNTTGDANTAFGGGALQFNISGLYNTATGYQALFANTTGSRNVAGGFRALLSNTTGTNNMASGFEALRDNTTGNYNTASGDSALFANTTGAYNTASGYFALNANTVGFFNTASGNHALTSNTTGSRNVAVGSGALGTQSFSNGGAAWDSDNVAVGFEALRSNQPISVGTGRQNTALGNEALYSNTFAYGNTAAGYTALRSNVSGIYNTATGWKALFPSTTGDVNTAYGALALGSTTTGSNNTAVGAETLLNNTVGTNNTAVGYGANVLSNNQTNSTAIGYLAIANASNKVRIGNGNVTVIEGQVAFTASSDRTKKENFQPVDGAEVLRKIRRFELTSWNYIGHDPQKFRHYGPMAQDFHAAFGHDAVGTIGTETTINSGDLAGILMSAVQELANENAALKTKLAERDAKDRERDERLARLERLLPPAPVAAVKGE